MYSSVLTIPTEPPPHDYSGILWNQNQTNEPKGTANNLVISHHKKKMCLGDGPDCESNLSNTFSFRQITAFFLLQGKGKWASVFPNRYLTSFKINVSTGQPHTATSLKQGFTWRDGLFPMDLWLRRKSGNTLVKEASAFLSLCF